MSLEIALSILVAVFTLVFLAHLVYTVPDLSRRKAAADRLTSKFKKDTAGYYIAHRIYTPRFLTAWNFITASSILGTVLDLYELGGDPSAFVTHTVFVLSMLISITGLCLLWLAFRKV